MIAMVLGLYRAGRDGTRRFGTILRKGLAELVCNVCGAPSLNSYMR